ncbi:MAG: chromate resistance protein ChrB domain-containing protein [Candidatus Binatia bacterium]
MENIIQEESGGRWLLLIHQIPPKPDYLRVKIWRRLQRLGSVPIKNSVYVLPKSEQAQEDFQWVLREVTKSGGDASLCEARFVDGLTDDEVEELFRSARELEYREISRAAERLRSSLPKKSKISGANTKQFTAELEKLHKRLAEIAAIDFFGAPGREAVERLIFVLDARLREPSLAEKTLQPKLQAEEFRGRTWVTRKGIHVDRMGSAWLIRHFIDPAARFKFVPAKGYQPQADELRFDMYEAEFTHEGDRCTFEVLLEKFALKDPPLKSIAEIIHDIDLKDSKFAREETIGIDRLIAGIAMGHKDDESRLERASAMFDDLYEYFKRKQD